MKKVRANDSTHSVHKKMQFSRYEEIDQSYLKSANNYNKLDKYH